MSNISPELEALVQNFVGQLVAAVEADVSRRIQGAFSSALGSTAGAAATRRPVGRPPSSLYTPVSRPAKPVSRELAAARKLQGQYLGALRGLKPADHAKVKALAHEKSLEAAIKLARSLKS
jgi:hypothetical protein